MSNLILQNIINDLPFDNLPPFWRLFDLKDFSKDKRLYGFQEAALENALKALWLYYGDRFKYAQKEGPEVNQKRKEHLLRIYRNNGLDKDLGYSLTKKEAKKTARLLEEFYEEKDKKIGFENFLNRMSFWMATGSGKTLVIVKLIEILKKLMENKEIPEYDILFLTHREDLIEQFKEFVREFSGFDKGVVINLKSLKDYESAKRDSRSLFKDKEITIFYYRSDLLSDEHKDKIVNFMNYDNNGKWYILLDEAHKGDKEDSKRQMIYSVLSRNGFLFNFSATFTDARDAVTTAFEFNLESFISEGYGKHIYMSDEEIKAFGKEDFSEAEKQKIVLKTLILLSYIRKFAERAKKTDRDLYHNPLLLTLVNSVNTEDADLELFFKTLETVAEGKISKGLFKEAKQEILKSFAGKRGFLFGDEKFELDSRLFNKLSFEDVLKDVFNAGTAGSIEVLTIPNNRKEMVFKLKTSNKPFALIKIGDISGWLKQKLRGYEINESFDNESVFRRINRDDSAINILMGSRGFYEGWDSNRPNIVLFINIGIGKEAKKFVLQSVGRGVRIEPLKNKRKRLQVLYNAKEVSDELYEKLKDTAAPIETLYLFGTNKEALERTFNYLKKEGRGECLVSGIELNKLVEDNPLFIPVYKPAGHTFAESRDRQKFSVGRDDLEMSRRYFDYLGDDRVFLMHYGGDVRTVNTIRKSFKEQDEYYVTVPEGVSLKPSTVLEQVVRHLSLIPEEFDRFKHLQEEIVHFKKIRFRGRERLGEFLQKIEAVRKYGQKEERLQQLEFDFDSHRINTREFREGIQRAEQEHKQEEIFKEIKIKYAANHYYIPLLLSEDKKIDYISHIIKEPSEVNFINELERYLLLQENLFSKYDWWLFSKIDEHIDEVYLPYYDPERHCMANFKPDFIFWLKKGRDYSIIFIDPKSYKFTDYEHKIDWYKRIFEDEGSPKIFKEGNFRIKVYAFLRCEDAGKVGEGYRDYWFDSLGGMLRRVSRFR